MRKLKTGVVVGLLTLSSGGAAWVGCSSGDSGGSGDPADAAPAQTAELRVEVNFPSDTAKNETASLHVWALAAKTVAPATCSALIGGELDPYDLALERRADLVTEPGKLPAVANEVLLGPALIYVEGVTFDGKVELAGCLPTDIIQPSTTAVVSLQAAGVFDCADPATEEGAPCSDGKTCTIGETCDNGVCKNGTPRDCTFVVDPCNAESCDEVLGCQPIPIPDNTPCDDGLYCTEGDICKAGTCSGGPRDCQATSDPCQLALGCSESLDQCQYQTAPSGTACDDGNYCTINDICSSGGSCYGQQRDCSAVADTCNNASCNESTDQCVKVPKSSSFSCTDNLACTVSEMCNGLGSCIGSQKNCSALNDQCNTGTCTEPLGTCVKTPVTNGTPCDDGIPSTSNDQCTNGVCAGT
jgi:hypothetical protein